MDIYFLNQPNCRAQTHHFLVFLMQNFKIFHVDISKIFRTIVAITLPSSDHLLSKSTRETM